MLLGWLLVALCALPAAAQQQPDPATRVADELAGVNRSLDQLVTMMQTMMEYQEIDLVLKRIEMKERRVLPLESALRNARETVTSVSSELERMQSMVQEWEDAESRAVREGREQEAAEFRQMIAHSRAEVEYQTATLDRYEQRVRELEDDIALLNRDLRGLDELLGELLER
jgi:chromosome segregation ATPase